MTIAHTRISQSHNEGDNGFELFHAFPGAISNLTNIGLFFEHLAGPIHITMGSGKIFLNLLRIQFDKGSLSPSLIVNLPLGRSIPQIRVGFKCFDHIGQVSILSLIHSKENFTAVELLGFLLHLSELQLHPFHTAVNLFHFLGIGILMEGLYHL